MKDESLKPYPEMKDSGFGSLGMIPSHWQVRKLRHILRRRTERDRPNLPLLSVVREQGVILRDVDNKDENHNFIPDDLTNYKVVRVGQFAMNKMKAWQGSYGVSPYDGIVSPAYFVFDIAGVEGPFFHRAIRSRQYVPSFTRASDGVRIGQWDLSEARMKEIPFAIPPPVDQAAIVSYLNDIDARITLFVKSKQRQIQLLEEQRRAVIHRGVTRGATPVKRLKRSGAEWFDLVPEHWEVVRLGSVLRERRETNDDGEVTEVLSVLRGRGVIPYDEKGNIGNKKSEDITRYKIVRPDDIVVNCMNVIIGSSGLSRYTGCLSPVYYVLSCRSDQDNPHYLSAVFQSEPFYKSLVRIGSGILAHRLRIPMELLKCELLPRPPRNEQDAIVRYISEESKGIVDAISRTNSELELVGEWRARLIADVVTGKLDVRGRSKVTTNGDVMGEKGTEPTFSVLEDAVGEDDELQELPT